MWSLFITILTLASSIFIPIRIYLLDCRRREKEKLERNIQQAQDYLNQIKLLPNILSRINNNPFSFEVISQIEQAVRNLDAILIKSFNTNCFHETFFYFLNILKHLYNIENIEKFNTDDYRHEVINDIDAKFSPKDIPGVKKLVKNKTKKKEKTSSFIRDKNCELIRIKIKEIVNDPNKKMCLNENLEIYIKHLTLVISRYIDSYEKNDDKSLEIIEKEEQESKTLLCYETLVNKCYASLNDAAKSEIIQAFRRSYPVRSLMKK